MDWPLVFILSTIIVVRRGFTKIVKVGILGLGKMGSALALSLLSKRNEVHVYDRSKEKLRELVSKRAITHPFPYEPGKS